MDRGRDPRWAYLFVNLATILWSSNIALGRVLRDSISPISLTTARFVFAGILFLVLMRGNFSQLRLQAQDWIILLLMAISGVFGFPILLYLALNYTTASHMALLIGLTPLITLFLAAIFLGESITANRIIGGLLSLFGVYLVISNGSILLTNRSEINMGDLLGLLCALLWGLYSVFSRIATRRMSTLTATSISTWMGLPMLIPLTFIEWQNSLPDLTASIILAGIYIGIFPTVISFMLWNESIRRVGAGHAMAFYNMLPIYGTLLGVVFLRENISWPFVVGGVLVISGSLIAIRENVIQENIARYT
jgi:drug/metabolite transporter (DMT)-like permease